MKRKSSAKGSRSADHTVEEAEASATRGIGHNSLESPEINSENVTGVTYLASVLAAHNAVYDYDRSMGEAYNTTRPFAYVALTAINFAIADIYAASANESFRNEHHIVSNGNTANEYHALVVFFFRKLPRNYVRQTASRWAGIITLGAHLKIKPNDFLAWITECGIENLFDQYKALKVPPTSDFGTQESIANTILADPNVAPTFQASPETFGYFGRHLAVVELASDGSGAFQLLAILPHSRTEITRMLVTIARKRASE